jgi:4-amino-4-deoxy-L-arabinose transferase-like glycosyltransferase
VSALAWTLLAVLVRVAWLAAVPPAVAWDGVIYERTAWRIAHGMGFVDTYNNVPPFLPTAFYPVGYPGLLALAHAFLGPGAWVAGALNVFAAAITTAVVFTLARRAFGAPAAHLSAALYALSPGAVL